MMAFPIARADAGTLSVVGTNAWAGQVHEYANPFDPNLDRNASETTVTVSNGWAVASGMDNVVNRTDARGYSLGGRLTKAGASIPGEPTWAVLRAPASFTARTLIVLHTVWFGFSSPQPLAMKFGTGASPDWAAISASYSDPGTLTQSAFGFTNLHAVADSLRLDYSETALYSGVYYADLQDVVVLPDPLRPMTNVTVSASMTTWGSPANLVDRKDDGVGWAAQNAGQKDVTFTFDRPRRITAMIIFSYENVDAVFDVKDQIGTAVANVTMTIGPRGWVLPMRFDEPLVGSTVKFDFGTAANAALREVMFFEDMPRAGTVLVIQ